VRLVKLTADHVRVFLWAAVATLVLSAPAGTFAQTAEEARQDRRDILAGILHDTPPELVAKMRRGCIAGTRPATIQKDRALGEISLPDAADYCATALYRIARDGSLLAFYRESLPRSASDVTYEKMPAVIAASIMKFGTNQVPLGNGDAAVITPALALDAGFTVAYRKSERYAPGMPQAAALKPIAERCLAQRERDLSLCFSTGYAYGALAASGLPVAAP
jgi:hypothetical protein